MLADGHAHRSCNRDREEYEAPRSEAEEVDYVPRGEAEPIALVRLEESSR